MNERTGNVTELLARVEESDPAAREELFELVYDELRQLASGMMARERPGHTLDCTGLVNEAAARLLGHEDVQMGSCRAHFFATMVQAMRRVLVEHARRRNRLRREGSHQRVPLDETLERLEREQHIDVLDLDEALADFRAVATAGMPGHRVAILRRTSARAISPTSLKSLRPRSSATCDLPGCGCIAGSARPRPSSKWIRNDFQQVKELVLAALEQPPEARGAFLQDACRDDATLRAEVESLLADDADVTDHFLAPLPLTVAAGMRRTPSRVGQRIGSYEIEELIGTGGMGEVYRARRVDDFQQIVALKLVRQGMVTDETLGRFKNEMQLLAAVGEHPNIARLFDAGTTDDGLPYFVMEYVDGHSIDRHCDERRLTIRERLELFCRRVQGGAVCPSACGDPPRHQAQ